MIRRTTLVVVAVQLLIVGTLYANRETVAPVAIQEVPHSAEWLLGPFRVVRFAA